MSLLKSFGPVRIHHQHHLTLYLGIDISLVYEFPLPSLLSSWLCVLGVASFCILISIENSYAPPTNPKLTVDSNNSPHRARYASPRGNSCPPSWIIIVDLLEHNLANSREVSQKTSADPITCNVGTEMRVSQPVVKP